MARGRRQSLRSRRRRRVPAIRTLNYATAATGTQTTFARKDFQVIASCGDRAFKIVGLQLQVSSLTEPCIVQIHKYNRQGDEIALCNRLVSSTGKSIINLRIPRDYKCWYPGETSPTTALIRVDLLKTYADQKAKVSFLLNLLLRFGTPEPTSR